MSTSYLLEDIFVAGGLPSVTYVERTTDDVNRSFIKSISQPNSIVSLTGPTKSGKKQYYVERYSKTRHIYGLRVGRFQPKRPFGARCVAY